MKTFIEIKNLCFAYDKENVLENINLDVAHDDFLAIIGPNGGGKSTLLKLILGLLKPKSGKIMVNVDRAFLGYVPQNTNLNINFPITALEVVLMGHIGGKRTLFGYSKEERSCAMNSLKQVGMEDFADIKIGNLSGGQRQRVFIARALCANPKIILLDEPTASIDVKGQQEVYDLLKRLSQNIAVVVVSHDISVLLNYAKNVVHVNKSMVYHKLQEMNNKVKEGEHLCEVELLAALGHQHSCGCKHEE
ncbi:MAG: metal ABC transporter ATP-binding protein [Candidatus Marinarcus sp.]|uniref:metal ABC transporter ATP-binding protein n=1 Tax=Candidatus Marinarcus sp. TaxID=3100987 RepID=UPI003B00B8B2